MIEFPTVEASALSPRPAGGPDPAQRSEGGGAVSRASDSPPLAIIDGGPPASGGTGREIVDLGAVLLSLRERDYLSVMVEGGASVLGSAFDMGLVDEVWAFVAPVIIGGGQPAVAGEGPQRIADACRLHDIHTEALGRDMLFRGLTAEEDRLEAPCSLAS